MKNIVLIILAICLAQSAAAYDAENIRAFLKKNKTCSFAVYKVMRGKTTREQFPQRFDVTCVGDIVVGENTVHEKKGCALFNYNVETGKMYFHLDSGPRIIEGVKCANGGFEKLIDSYYYDYSPEMAKNGVSQDKTLVRSALDQFPESNEPASFFRLVVYSDNDAYRTKLGYPKEDVDLKTLDVSKKIKKKNK